MRVGIAHLKAEARPYLEDYAGVVGQKIILAIRVQVFLLLIANARRESVSVAEIPIGNEFNCGELCR